MNTFTCGTCGLPINAANYCCFNCTHVTPEARQRAWNDILRANEQLHAAARNHKSLRDELAMAAIASGSDPLPAAKGAYAIADAMLIERENDLAGWKKYPELPETERSVLVLIGGVAHEPALVRARCIRDDRQGEPPRRWALYEAVGLPRRFVELGAVAAWREAPPLPPSLKTW